MNPSAPRLSYMTTPTYVLCRGNLPHKCRDDAGPALAHRFGGWTRTAAVGAWVAPDGALIVEEMDVWEVATCEPDAFVGMIVALGEKHGEHSVYVVTPDGPRIIETANAKADGLRD